MPVKLPPGWFWPWHRSFWNKGGSGLGASPCRSGGVRGPVPEVPGAPLRCAQQAWVLELGETWRFSSWSAAFLTRSAGPEAILGGTGFRAHLTLRTLEVQRPCGTRGLQPLELTSVHSGSGLGRSCPRRGCVSPSARSNLGRPMWAPRVWRRRAAPPTFPLLSYGSPRGRPSMTAPCGVSRLTRSWLRLLSPRGCPPGLCAMKARSRRVPGVASLRATLLVLPCPAWGPCGNVAPPSLRGR